MTMKVIVCSPELQFFSLKFMITTYQIWSVLQLRPIFKYLFSNYYIYPYIINLYIYYCFFKYITCSLHASEC
jgi:hypothetical protein